MIEHPHRLIKKYAIRLDPRLRARMLARAARNVKHFPLFPKIKYIVGSDQAIFFWVWKHELHMSQKKWEKRRKKFHSLNSLKKFKRLLLILVIFPFLKVEMYMIHCTRVITDLALIIYIHIMSKSLFVGSGPKMKFVQRDVPTKAHLRLKTPRIDINHFHQTLFILRWKSLTI